MHLSSTSPDHTFRADAKLQLQKLRQACQTAGFTPLSRHTMNLSWNLTSRERAAWIKEANRQLIEAADAVIANVSPFRGPNMDPGTAWEIGYAEAKGLPVFLWSEEPKLLEERTAGTGGRDLDGWLIESFGLAENLMIAVNPNGVAPSFEAALNAVLTALASTQDDNTLLLAPV